MRGVPGSHYPWFADVLYRQRGAAEGRVRTNTAMGLANLPSQAWDVTVGWVLAANLAADLNVWTRLLGLHGEPELAVAEPETLRYRLWHLPARLISHARRRILRIPVSWPWAKAFTTCCNRLAVLPHPGRPAPTRPDNRKRTPRCSGNVTHAGAPRACTDATTRNGADRSSENEGLCDAVQLTPPAESSRLANLRYSADEL